MPSNLLFKAIDLLNLRKEKDDVIVYHKTAFWLKTRLGTTRTICRYRSKVDS